MSASLGPAPIKSGTDARVTFGRGRAAVSVDELRRAWAAVVAGDFRRPTQIAPPHRPGPTRTASPDMIWRPPLTERVLPVIGSVGSCGATTLAVALATAAYAQGCRTRVLECAGLTATGLAAASTAELGTVPGTGWIRGVRDLPDPRSARAETGAGGAGRAGGAGGAGRGVVLDRVAAVLTRVDETPLPPANGPTAHGSAMDGSAEEGSAAEGFDLTVLDAGWMPGQLLAATSWVSDQVLARPGVVLTTATGPGLRRLEVTLSMLPSPHAWCVAVVGPRRRRWGSAVSREVGPLTSALIGAGRLVEVPVDRHLAAVGLTINPLPHPLVAAATAALRICAMGGPPPTPDRFLAEPFGGDRTQDYTQDYTQEGSS